MTIHEHSRLLAGFFFIKGALSAVGWLFMGGFFGGEWMLAIFAAFFMITGWKIQNDSADAKLLGIVASVLCIGSFPIGTVLGIYGLWFFLMRSKEEF